MLVKESSDLALQLSCVVRLPNGNGVFKEFVLNICRQIVPLHDDSGAQALQNMLLFLGKGSQVIPIFLRCALCSAALVIPSCEGIGLFRAIACSVRHRLALDLRTASFYHLAGAPGMNAATPSGLMLKTKNVKLVLLGFPH